MADQEHPARDIVKSPRFQFANVDIDGSPDNAMKVTVTGLGQIGGSQSVFLQVRNIEDEGALDVFGLHLLRVTSDRIIFRITRLDEKGGWGQRLRVQIMIVSM